MRVTKTISVGSVVAPSGGAVTWNLTTATSFSEHIYLNIAKQVDGWDSNGQAVTAQGNLDMTGAPATGNTRRFTYYLGTDPGRLSHQTGLYNVFWDGGAGVTVSASLGGTTITNDGSGTPGQAQFSVSSFDNNRAINFDGIAASDPPTNIRIVKAEHQALFDAGEIFHPGLISVLDGTSHTLRFMDMMETNGSTLTSWSEYPQESWQLWRKTPISALCKLANRVNAAPWFCVPHMADDDFVTQMATTIDATLDAGVKAVVEYSNEVWNYNFPQTGWCRDRSLALWPAETQELRRLRAFAGMRFVQCMNLCEAVSATRFEGLIAGQAASVSTIEYMADALIWRDATPDTGSSEYADYFIAYERPHARATYASFADYFAYVADGASDAFMGVFDAQGAAAATVAFNEWCASTLPSTRDKIDAHVAFSTAADTVNGTLRNLTPRTYEGGSAHCNMAGDYSGGWYRPQAWASGVSVLEGEYRKNQYGRVYKSTAAGVTGATEPTHVDASTISDGTVSWIDLTGQLVASAGNENELRVDVANGLRLTTTGANVQAYSATTYTAGQFVENTNGTIYEVMTGGTASAEPTHTSGTQTVGGVEYRAIIISCSDRGARPEVKAWMFPLFYTSEHTNNIIRLFNYQLQQGCGSPACFTLLGYPGEFGVWGRMVDTTDFGPSRTNEGGNMMLNWSRVTSVT